MEVSGEGASVYAEAKGEYTRQLCQYLVPAIHTYFLEMLTNAKMQEGDTNKQLLCFQTLMEGIPEWNIDKVQHETQRILISTQCDYIEELLTAVFIAHTKVLSAIRLTNKQKKLQITIPKLEHFLHRTLKECARLLWTNTYLFSESYSPLDRQKNMRQVEGLVSEGVLQGVRTMLPVKSILREYLATEDTDDTESEYESETDESEEEEPEADDKEVHVEKPKKSIVTAVKNEVPPVGPSGSVGPSSMPKVEQLALPAPKTPAVLNLDSAKPSVSFTETNTQFDATPDAKPVPATYPDTAEFVDTDDIAFEDVEESNAPVNNENMPLEFDFETLA
jgi:hypothetical protein